MSEAYFSRKSDADGPPTFLRLRARLVAAVEVRIRNGLLTERGLARRVGASQPHIHNVLKGVRGLSPELSDRILAELGLTILDLVEGGAEAVTIAATPRPLRDRFPAPVRPSAAS